MPYNKKPTIREKKYCSCVIKSFGSKHQKDKMKENPKLNPYSLCTHVMYNAQDKKRKQTIECDKILKFEKYDINSLRGYAKSKGIKVTQNGKYKNKNDLVTSLNKLKTN